MKEGLFHLVRLHEAPEWERAGWCWSDNLGHPHGHWSVLMRWLCDCEPVFPNKRVGE